MLYRTLIVDDSLPLHQLIKVHLDGEGLEFHSAYDGETALSKASQLRPSLILLDVDMPGMDGFEVCRRLKANLDTDTIPVIFLTADADTCDKVKGLNLGAVDYVTKPFKPEELSARVRASLRIKPLFKQNAVVDGVTGARSREYLQGQLAEQLSLAATRGQSLACISVDVDGLQQINHQHGVSFADDLLRALAQLLVRQCRGEDSICHCEGGRFVIIVPGMDRTDAGRLAGRLCDQVQRELAHHKVRDVGLTCSFGVADTQVASDSSLLERSDAALMRAKQNGGKSVSIARPRRSPASRVALACEPALDSQPLN